MTKRAWKNFPITLQAPISLTVSILWPRPMRSAQQESLGDYSMMQLRAALYKKNKNEGEDNRHNNTRSLGNKGLKMSLTSRLRCLVVSINWEALASSIVTTSPSRHTRAATTLCEKKTRAKEKNHNKSVERGFLELSARPQHLRAAWANLFTSF